MSPEMKSEIKTGARLTLTNFQKGFLIDENWLGGVASDPQNPGGFVAYILDTQTGTSVGSHAFESLAKALSALNRIPRNWKFEAVHECSGGGCEGDCKGGKCANKGSGTCPL